jgi:FkbM family methyltransferase
MILLTNEEIVQLFYKKTLEANPTEFIEVGCFEASASKFLSSKMPNCKVTAYEANPINYEHFSNELKKCNINYVNKAISNFNGETTFHLLDTVKINIKSSLSKRTKSRKTKPVIVSCSTLNKLHFKNNNTYSIWIDAEGHGYEVLQGASDLLPNTKCILIEAEKEQFWLNQKLDVDIIKYLELKGFTAIAKDSERSQYNILFEKNSNP